MGGIQTTSGIIGMAHELMGGRSPFSVYTFGYGADHDADMLKQISEACGGMYSYIDSNDVIAQSFGDCLGGLLSVAAQNITIKINSKLDGYAVSSVCSHLASNITHAMACYEQSHAMQRCNRVSSKEETRQTSYSSPMRMLFRGKAKSST